MADKKKEIMSIDCRVVEIGDTKEFGNNGFKKRDLICVDDTGQYENIYVFEFVQDKTELIDDLMPDSYVTVCFNIRCRRVERPGKEDIYFTSLQGWKIDLQ